MKSTLAEVLSPDITHQGQVRPEQRSSLESQHPAVVECYLMTGETDYLIRVVAADIDRYQEFLTRRLMKIPAVRAVRSSLVLRQAFHKTALPVELAIRSQAIHRWQRLCPKRHLQSSA